MALSNWAITALDNIDGKTDGELVDNALDYKINIYKSNVFIYDKQSFRENSGYRNNLVMKIEDNSFLKYHNIRIDTWHPESNEVYVTATIGYRHQNESEFRAFAGCGVYGYEGEEWVGVTDEQWEKLIEHIESSELVREDDFDLCRENEQQYNLGDKTITERMNEPRDIEDLYEDESDPLLESVFETDSR